MVIAAQRMPSLADARAAMAEGRLDAVVLTRQALQAAEACKEDVRAFAAIAHEHALYAAEESAHRFAAGKARPLEGLPIGVKDLVDTRGLVTQYGSAAYAGHVPAADAAIVSALSAQGAIVIGKTTTHEFAWGVTTGSTTFGNTLNPHDTSRIPGGSSGGAAASIAYGALAAGIGTDTGGSVRIPAALCGVVGFKPSFGTLPTQGIFPLAPSLDHPGLLGATVDDVMLLAGALGIGRGAAASASAASASAASAAPRFGVVRSIAPVPLEAGVAEDFGAAVDALGCHHACRELDADGLFDGVFQAFAGIVLAEGGVVHFGRHDRDFIEGNYGAETVDRLRRAQTMPLSEYAQAQHARRRFSVRLALAMQDVDYLLLPTCPCAAPPLETASVEIGGWSGTVREALMTYTAPFNLAGFPAVSLPLPMPAQQGRLPSGLQIVGRRGSDAALLQLAQAVERYLARRE